MKKYTTSRSYGDYYRIWMHRETWLENFQVGKMLSALSIWRGHDKDDGGLVSWEFHPGLYEEAHEYLDNNGWGWVSSIEKL